MITSDLTHLTIFDKVDSPGIVPMANSQTTIASDPGPWSRFKDWINGGESKVNSTVSGVDKFLDKVKDAFSPTVKTDVSVNTSSVMLIAAALILVVMINKR